jgi:hypothetical protein
VRPNRWLRAIGYGFLAELATVLTIILIVSVYRFVVARALPDAEYSAFGMRTGEIVGVVGGTLYTFLFARRLTRLLDSRFVAHGVLLALTAIAFSIGGSIAGHQGVPSAYVLASILKLAAGALAGFLAARRATALHGA